jgi:hypothetical protein
VTFLDGRFQWSPGDHVLTWSAQCALIYDWRVPEAPSMRQQVLSCT